MAPAKLAAALHTVHAMMVAATAMLCLHTAVSIYEPLLLHALIALSFKCEVTVANEVIGNLSCRGNCINHSTQTARTALSHEML